MLGRDEGRVFRLRATELEPLRECMQWLKEHNPHCKLYWTNAKRFGSLYEKLQAVVPRGNKDVPVRVARSRHVESAVAATLGETLGSEEAVLVVVDPAESPRNWATIDAFAEAIGDATYRASVEPAPSSQAARSSTRDTELPANWGRSILDPGRRRRPTRQSESYLW